MVKWKHQLNIKAEYDVNRTDNISDATLNNNAKDIGGRVAKKLQKLHDRSFKDSDCSFEFEEIIQKFEGISTTEEWENLCAEEGIWEDFPPIEEFNECMKELYDFADKSDVKIWILTR